MKYLTFSFLFLFCITSAANAKIGFSGKTNLKSISLSGSFTLFCHDPNQNQRERTRANCSTNTLNGGDRQFFHYQKEDLVADELQIKSTWEDGNTETKTEDFNSHTGISEDRFNLWIDTLFQDPLLDYGINKLELSFISDDEVVFRDKVTVNVTPGESRQCEHTTEYSNRISDCRSPRALCYRYFARNNFCK